MAQQIKIIYRNILENSTVTVTTENTSFPKYRLYDRDIGKLFKGNSAPANFYITLDQGKPISQRSLLHFNGSNGIPLGQVTFIFDDGDITLNTNGKPVFDSQGEPACVAAVTDLIATSGYCTWAQLQAMQSAGWEILSHTKTHADLTGLTETQITTELKDSQLAIEAQGLTCRNLVYPYGAHNPLVRRIVRQYYDSARGVIESLNHNVLKSYEIRAYCVDDHTLLNTYKSYVDSAYTNQRWVVFFLHVVTSDDATMLDQLIDYIQAKPMPIVTIAEGLVVYPRNTNVFKDEHDHVWSYPYSSAPLLSSSSPKFGSGKLVLDGVNDTLYTDEITSLGTAFTVEGWFYTGDKTQASQAIFSAENAAFRGLLLVFRYSEERLCLLVSSDGSTWNVSDGTGAGAGAKTSWVNNTWYKVVAKFNGSAYKVYVGEAGSLLSSDISITSALAPCAITGIYLGSFGLGTAWYLKGGLDEWRIRLGSTLYGAPFIPETAEFAADDPYQIDRLIIPVGHNLTSLSLKFQYSSDNFVSDIHDSLSWFQSGVALIDMPLTALTKNYWRLNIASPASAPELPEMFVGKTYTFLTNPLFGARQGRRRNEYNDESLSGLDFGVQFGDPRRFRAYELKDMGTSQKAEFEAFETLCGGIKPFWVEDHLGNVMFMKKINEEDFGYDGEDADALYSCRLDLREVLGATT
jgi:peptidoglycan/xylan/chitin deacetylase (PgdA/CDA1 family)